MKVYIIHENEEWTLPLKEHLKKLSVSFEDWHMDKIKVNTDSENPAFHCIAISKDIFRFLSSCSKSIIDL